MEEILNSECSGFTLLEVLIAVVLSSLVIFTASLALRAYIDSQKSIEEKISEESKKALFLYFFFKQLQNIPGDIEFIEDFRFEGGSDYLKFVSRVPMTGPFFPGVFGVEYKVRDGCVKERDFPLITRKDVLDFFKGNREENGNFTVVYATDVKIVGFEYYNGINWVREWKLINSIPFIIKIELENGTALYFPVSVALRLD